MDLKLGSIPVRVQGWFVLMALLLGANERDPAKLVLWVAIVVVSVVIHELGHALMGRAFGLVPRIELHGMGGTTSFQAPAGAPPRGELGTGQSIAISLAGPFAGFLFAIVVIVARLAGLNPTHPLAVHAVSLLFFVNIGWGIFNLLPMLPLDGGNVLHAVLRAITKKNGERAARVISVVVAAGIAALAIQRQQWWILYLGVLFAFRNVQALRQAEQHRADGALAQALDEAHRAFERNEPDRAVALLRPALSTRASADLRQVALRVYVASMMRQGSWGEAVDVIERERSVIGAEDLAHYARMMREVGRGAEADRIDQLVRAPAPLTEFRA